MPRELTASETATLKSLADLTIKHIESLVLARRASQSEALQNAILETMAEGVVVHAPDGKVRFANDAALSILGLSFDDLIGTTSMDPRWQSLREDGTPYPGEEHPAMVVLRTGKTVENATMRVARPDGINKWIKINARPMANPSLRDQAEVVVTFSDISDERDVQTTLLAKKKRLELALSVGAIGVVERNLNTGEIAKFGSGEAHTAFGPLDNVGPGTFLSRVTPEYQPEVIHAWEKHLNGGPGVRMEAPLIMPDGTKRWALFGAEKLLDAQNNHCGAIIAFTDIHQRKMSEFALVDTLKRLEAALQAKDAFLANVGHEIRTPLNGVIGMAAALAATSLTREQKQMASLVVSSGEVLNRLMNDLLDMSKLNAGKMTLQCEPFDLCAAVTEASQLYEIRADEKAIGFQLEFAPETRGEWQGDRVRIKQIVSNLVSNAIKFTDKGRVRVRLSATGSPGSSDAEWISIEVEDDGPGVSSDLETKIFERFEQGARAKNGEAGTGLGLSICKSLAELMGGEISLTSQEGLGSTFAVRLPLMRITHEIRPAQESPSDRANLMRVLLVDDNPTNLVVAQAMLRAFGCEIVTAQDGTAGVEAFKSGKFDIVLMDMSMPGMDGAAATRAIRKFERDNHARRTPLAMLTAYSSDQHKRESEAAGADFHIVKPVTPVSLLAGLEKAMRASKDQVAA